MTHTVLRSLAVAVLASAAGPARADEAPDPGAPVTVADLKVDLWRAASITAGGFILAGVVDCSWKTEYCNICGSNKFDDHVRDAL